MSGEVDLPVVATPEAIRNLQTQINDIKTQIAALPTGLTLPQNVKDAIVVLCDFLKTTVAGAT